MMSRIRSKNTRIELMVRRYLFRNGFRFRIHDKRLPGTPDIVMPKYRTVIFVHGCFWHGHEGCPTFRIPKTHIEFWREKIERNRVRDAAQIERLRNLSWRVMTVWECELRTKELAKATLAGLLNELQDV